jgi:hypothetical protein
LATSLRCTWRTISATHAARAWNSFVLWLLVHMTANASIGISAIASSTRRFCRSLSLLK